jgi:peptidyl-prolyl cis-trans isomerase SurA
MKLKIILLFFLYFFNDLVLANENKILFKVENEIITSLDILNEIRYLNSINNSFQNIKDNKKFQIAKNSLIRDKIKMIALSSIVEKIELNNEDFIRIAVSSYGSVGVNNYDQLIDHLNQFNIDLKTLKKKISISTVWNQFIYDRYAQNIKIDIEQIKKDILSDNKQNEYLLSEIVFNLEKNENLNQKFELIKKAIIDDGFNNSALTYSVSETSTTGGKLGWVKESSINSEILIKINSLGINEHTDPITIPGGFLILKKNDIRETKKEIDLEKELEQIIKIKTNEQLNQFSNLFLNKIKKDIVINEL